MNFFEQAECRNGVFYLSPPVANFSANYLKIRKLEDRIYSDDTVRWLPEPPVFSQKKEWNLRAATCHRLLADAHFGKSRVEKSPARLLDLGCGNGWFTHFLAKNWPVEILGIDINLPELEQAARLFSSEKCRFANADIFGADLPKAYFQKITLNASAQYFPDFRRLVLRLFELLEPGGEIHFFDTPFYPENEVAAARQRSINYYESMGCAEMADAYFHRSLAELAGFDWQFRWKPGGLFSKIKRLAGLTESPFPWIVIFKQRSEN